MQTENQTHKAHKPGGDAASTSRTGGQIPAQMFVNKQKSCFDFLWRKLCETFVTM